MGLDGWMLDIWAAREKQHILPTSTRHRKRVTRGLLSLHLSDNNLTNNDCSANRLLILTLSKVKNKT